MKRFLVYLCVVVVVGTPLAMLLQWLTGFEYWGFITGAGIMALLIRKFGR